MSTVTINGKTYVGNNVMVSNGKVIIDGTPYDDNDNKGIYINVTGDISYFKVDRCNEITITGNVKEFKNGSGDVRIGGDVDTVSCGSGDIDIQGNAQTIETGSGDVKVLGSVMSVVTSSGNIYKK